MNEQKEDSVEEKAFKLPKTGEIIVYDYRPQSEQRKGYQQRSYGEEKSKKSSPVNFPLNLKCVQWNIERGYKLDEIIQVLKGHRAEILCLQELDIFCERTGNRNCALELAEALKMKCAFLVEFEELKSTKRKARIQGGGVHGNAILSVFDFEPRIIPHKHHPINWEVDGDLLGEPRRGQRAILAADIFVPGLNEPVLCYSIHLELFCGIFGRLKQMADIFEDSNSWSKERPRQLVFGDLNTMAHGIARLVSVFCRDGMRYRSIGFSEAAWWHNYVLSHTDSTRLNPNLSVYSPQGLTQEDVKRLTNPFLFDPFSISKDTTLQGYNGLFRGKLDWTFLRGWHVLAKGMDNHHYHCSDHKLLYVIVKPVSTSEGEPGQVAYEENHVPLDPSNRLRSVAWNALTFGMALGFILLGVRNILAK